MPRSGAAQHLPSPLGRRKRRFGAVANADGFILGDGGQYVERQTVGVRVVAGDEFHAGLHDP
jgi:hypothetical protein